MKYKAQYIFTFFVIILLFITLSVIFIVAPASANENFSITEFPIGSIGNNLPNITSGPDGSLWFTEGTNKIGRITSTGVISEFPLPIEGSFPYDITPGSDGNIWFTETSNRIGRITTQGVITEYSIGDGIVTGITKGSDGNIWFANISQSKIGKITPDGIITQYSIPFDSSLYFGTNINDITLGSDGNIWFAESSTNKIGKITPNGDITEFISPSINSSPFDMAAGPDGNIWYTKRGYYTDKIGKITTNGIITEYPLTGDKQPQGITAGPDGNIWFTEASSNQIARIKTDGTITEYLVPTLNSAPRGITAGPDGNVWFTENRGNKIGRVETSGLVVTPSPTISPSPTDSPTDGILSVPYFSQNAAPWGTSEYDHTSLLGVTGYPSTFDRWGCAVTSVAMVLNYHNIKQFADGTPINPGTINEWLNNNNGYSYGYGKNGEWYSYLNWDAIGMLTQELYNQGKAPYKLEYNPPNPATGTPELLTQDLTVGNVLSKIPNILFVNNNGHFVVAKGVLNNTFAINDPEWNYPTLASFDNTYSQVKRYVPSQTNLSYITAIVNPDVEILVTDSQNRKTGKLVKDGQTVSFNEIPGASYVFDPPIANPNENGVLEKLGTGTNTLSLPKPNDGDYTVTLSGGNQTNYTLNLATYEVNGDNEINKTEGVVLPNEENSFSVSYSQSQPAEVVKVVTFQSTIKDINELFTLNLITQKSVTNSLIRNIEQAQKASLAGDVQKVIQNLNQFEDVLLRERARKINERAYQILWADAENLKKSLF
jgi:streptogramin lyase